MPVELNSLPRAVISIDPDLAGRKRMVTNVLASWITQAITIVAGFLMPRLIDHKLGQELLGVWDFSWSVAGYFSLALLGITGSINKYVGYHRAKGDFRGINCAVSSVLVVLLAMALLIVGFVALVCFWILPSFAAAKLGTHVLDAQWIILALGCEIVVESIFSAYGGVLTGCHQWKLYYGIQTTTNICTVVVMASCLVLGGNLRLMAAIHLAGTLGCWLCICAMAYRQMPTLQVRFHLASRTVAKEMFSFGAKSFIPQVGELLLHQTVNVMILLQLGPAALALYSRPRSLVQQIRILIARMGGILIPSASASHAEGNTVELRRLLTKSTRYAAFLAFPVASVFSIMGGLILELWMGPKYRSDIIPCMLSLSTTAVTVLIPAFSILMGMNLHGRPARLHALGCVITAGAVWIGLKVFSFGIAGVAVCASLPMFLIYVLYMPRYVAQHLGLSTWAFVKESMCTPVYVCLPLIACLVLSRVFLSDLPILSLSIGCGTGFLLTAPLYWKYGIPDPVRGKLLQIVHAFHICFRKCSSMV